MAHLRIVGKGKLTGRSGVYWRVDTENGDVLICEDNMKIEAPREGEAVALTHEYGRNGLIVTCCRSADEPEAGA